jgi:hypothetical protein
VNIYYRKPSYDVLDVLGVGIDDDQFKPASEGRYLGLKRSLHNIPENIEFQLKSFMNSDIRSI